MSKNNNTKNFDTIGTPFEGMRAESVSVLLMGKKELLKSAKKGGGC